jgi:hypothetical protein
MTESDSKAGKPRRKLNQRLTAEQIPDKVRRRLAALRGAPDACWDMPGRYWQLTISWDPVAKRSTFAGANRVAAALAYGEVPEGMVVMHSCDRNTCVNPEHLIIATQQDNMDDMGRKGRRKYFSPEERAALGEIKRRAYAEGRHIRNYDHVRGGNHHGAKPVRSPEGQTWETTTEAAAAIGCSISTMWDRCRRGSRGWSFIDIKGYLEAVGVDV